MKEASCDEQGCDQRLSTKPERFSRRPRACARSENAPASWRPTKTRQQAGSLRQRASKLAAYEVTLRFCMVEDAEGWPRRSAKGAKVGGRIVSQRSRSSDTEEAEDGRRIESREEGGGRPTEHTEHTEEFEQEKTERTEDRGGEIAGVGRPLRGRQKALGARLRQRRKIGVGFCHRDHGARTQRRMWGSAAWCGRKTPRRCGAVSADRAAEGREPGGVDAGAGRRGVCGAPDVAGVESARGVRSVSADLCGRNLVSLRTKLHFFLLPVFGSDPQEHRGNRGAAAGPGRAGAVTRAQSPARAASYSALVRSV